MEDAEAETAHRAGSAASSSTLAGAATPANAATNVKPLRLPKPWSLERASTLPSDGLSAPASAPAIPDSAPASAPAIPDPAPASAPAPAIPDPTPDTARAWLRPHTPAGPALIQLSAAIADGRIALPALPSVVKGQVFLPYPAALTGLDQPPETLLADLKTRVWIALDALKPMLVLQNHEGICGLWLTRAVSRQVIALGLDLPVAFGVPALADPVSDVPPPPVASPPRPARVLGGPLATTTAEAYARAIRERLLAHDATLGPIAQRGQTLSVPLKGAILDGAKRIQVTETALTRALANLPDANVKDGVLTLGL